MTRLTQCTYPIVMPMHRSYKRNCTWPVVTCALHDMMICWMNGRAALHLRCARGIQRKFRGTVLSLWDAIFPTESYHVGGLGSKVATYWIHTQQHFLSNESFSCIRHPGSRKCNGRDQSNGHSMYWSAGRSFLRDIANGNMEQLIFLYQVE